jgi:CO/xanthine dehydrogenase FAD-binding subunit
VPVRWIDEEDRGSLPQALFETEARRCLNCGCVAVTPSDTGTALAALDATIVTTHRRIPAGQFFDCRQNSSTVLEPGELVKEVQIPAAGDGSRSTFQKFRLRQSIDFPIVSAAVSMKISEGVILVPRVVLGAVAPVPVRDRQVEQYLTGKTAAELKGSAAEDGAAARLPCQSASDYALDAAIPLAENEYKVRITRAYLRRALCACMESTLD